MRVVRFYVSALLLLLLLLLFLFLSLPRRRQLRCVLGPLGVTLNRVCEIDQCSAPDLNCDIVGSVFRAGPQLRYCGISVPCRTKGASGRVWARYRTYQDIKTAWIDRSPCISTTLISVKFNATILFRQGLNSTKVVDMGCGQNEGC